MGQVKFLKTSNFVLKIGNIFLQQEIDFLQCGLACHAASHCHANNKTVGSMRDKLMLIQTFMYKLYYM